MSKVDSRVLFLPGLLVLKLLTIGLSGSIWDNMTGSILRQTRVHKTIAAMGYCLANREEELWAVIRSNGKETNCSAAYAVFETKPWPVREEP